VALISIKGRKNNKKLEKNNKSHSLSNRRN
jgi:hypothetical protein